MPTFIVMETTPAWITWHYTVEAKNEAEAIEMVQKGEIVSNDHEIGDNLDSYDSEFSATISSDDEDYTVIGVYEYGHTFTKHVRAGDPHEAIARAADDSDNDRGLQIIGAVKGWLDLTASCEDSGKSAYACDLGTGADK